MDLARYPHLNYDTPEQYRCGRFVQAVMGTTTTVFWGPDLDHVVAGIQGAAIAYVVLVAFLRPVRFSAVGQREGSTEPTCQLDPARQRARSPGT